MQGIKWLRCFLYIRVLEHIIVYYKHGALLSIVFISICYISDVSKKMEGQSDASPQYFQKVMKGRNVVIN